MGDLTITKRILLYVEDHLDQELSLEKIAQALNYSKYYIARTFKEHTGMTLHKYIQSRRLDDAARKLAETKQPIVEIAFEAGYSTQQAFTQAFRCMYAVTPQEYRRIGIFDSKQIRIRSSHFAYGSETGQLILAQGRIYSRAKQSISLTGWKKARAAS